MAMALAINSLACSSLPPLASASASRRNESATSISVPTKAKQASSVSRKLAVSGNAGRSGSCVFLIDHLKLPLRLKPMLFGRGVLTRPINLHVVGKRGNDVAGRPDAGVPRKPLLSGNVIAFVFRHAGLL